MVFILENKIHDLYMVHLNSMYNYISITFPTVVRSNGKGYTLTILFILTLITSANL